MTTAFPTWRQGLLLLGLCCSLLSCAGPKARDFAEQKPVLDPKAYFTGHLSSTGTVKGPTGKVRDRFTTRIHGVPNREGLLLIQDFTFDNGRREHRVWDIHVIDSHHFEGHANDSVGRAYGEAWGNAFEWNYTLAVPVKGQRVNVDFHQIMRLQPDGTLLNEAKYSKYGVRLGSITESFHKE